MPEKTAKEQASRMLWQVRPVWPQRDELARALGVPPLIAQLLGNRGITHFEAAQKFLQPSLNDLVEPGRLVGIPAAVQRIRRAIRDKERIVLYGDYDVDGIAGLAILWHCLRLAGLEVEYYVPHRIEEGYGLNAEAVRHLADKQTDLIITVDCGISGFEAAELAAERGIDLIITDHHQVEDTLPQAHSIVHPDLPGQDYPCRDLCGAGVAFKLAWALAQECSQADKVTPEFREFLISATGLAALATIADVVPLQGENRILAHYGLTGLAASDNPGTRALIEAAGLTGTALNSAHIGFRLAPRLNAAGRLGHARLAVELFTRSTPARARQIAAYLEAQNQQRRKIEKQIAEEAAGQVRALGMHKDDWRGIVVAGQDWHGGVIGIVASRLVDGFHKPAVVISLTDDKAMGSCRSVNGFDICQALTACAGHLVSFGGHAMAAGLHLKPNELEPFREAFNRYACANLSSADLRGKLAIDAEVKLADLSVKVLERIERLGPFGAGNPEVLLAATGLKLAGPPRRMGPRGDHLQWLVADGDDPDAARRPGGLVRAVAFGQAKWEKKLIDADRVDLAFEPSLNHFNGNTTVELIVRDVRIP
ncbi:MAG: single-stranded-DNA-specific exonuclease RecJ [Sedimentisphaerales bacterium]|nr:single-stranded-DNA-specific exonuclease RecJ [Sedimentisphaerales bacterium]